MPQQQYLSTDPNDGEPVRPAAQSKYLSTDPNEGEPLRVATKARGLLSPSTIDDFPVVNAAKGAWNVVREIPAGVKQLVTDPLGSVQMMGEAQGRLGVQSKEAFDQGEYVTALRKGLHYLLPLIGPMIDPSADKMLEGKIAEGTGEVVTNAMMALAGARPGGASSVRPRGLMNPTKNPAEAAAVAFGRQEGIPLDAGTVTGSQFVKNVQKKTGGSWGGANTVESAQRAQGEALSATGQRLAAKANDGKAVGGVEAGEGVQGALKRSIEESHRRADAAYAKLRAFEQQKPTRPAPADAMTALDVSERTPLAVNVTAAVEQLQPLYTRLLRESELGIPMQGSKGRTLAALDGLMNGPNWAPLSVVDAALSDLKAMARGADMPELRTPGQATAAQAVQQLDAQVRAAAARGGPEVLQALEEGRAATKTKYATSEAMDLIVPASGEPRAIFSRLVANKDAGLAKLRELQKQAPEELPNVARAVLEEIMEKPTSEGGFKFADKAHADWQKLGPETKRILFPKPGHAKALDQFFLLAKRIGENPNPSGTAQTLNATNIIAGVPMYALAKLLYTPSGVRAVTGAMRVSVSPKPAAQAAALAQLVRAGQDAGVTLPFPKAADSKPEERQ